VLLNLIGNGLYAATKRLKDGAEPNFRPILKVTTRDLGEGVEIRIRDNGVGIPSVNAPLQARENVGIVAARGRMLSSVRPSMRQEHSRRPVWEFADRVQITRSVLEAQWKALVVPAPSRRLLRHTLLPLALTSSRSWSAYAATAGAL
jgi:hypothetical protein